MTDTKNSPVVKKKTNIKSLIYRIFLIVIAGLTVGLSFFSWNASRVVGNQLPMPFGFGASVILSGSMEPTLKVNDLVFITESDDYQVDDIVVYQEGKELIIHRIIEISDDRIVTKGDANNTEDLPITRDMIKGKYNFRIPFIGLIFRWIKTLPGTILIIALVVYLMYRSRKKERKSGEEELVKIAEEIRLLRTQQLSDTQPAAVDAAEPSAAESAERKDAEDLQPVSENAAAPLGETSSDEGCPDDEIETMSEPEAAPVDAAEAFLPQPASESGSGADDSADEIQKEFSELSDIIHQIDS